MSISNTDYYSFLQVNDVKAWSPEEVGRDYEASNKEWYHLLLNENDFPLLIAAPNIKWYSICRCHLVSDDMSTAHEHMHALVHFTNYSTLLGFKKKLQRIGKRLNSKTIFKKIICLDHAVGVLTYIACEDGQKPLRRDGDGLRGTPHCHYSRQVFSEEWLHGRGKLCPAVRNEISSIASRGVSDHSKHTSREELHDKSSCLCDRGDIGIKKREDANARRRAFYLTEEGVAVRKRYKKKQEEKRKIIKTLTELGINKKAELQRETILKLIELL